MKPKEQTRSGQHLFETTLEDLCNPNQPLVVLAKQIDWKSFDTCYESLYCENIGAPAIPTRLMVGLQYLKYIHNLSDEETVARWVENPYWQYFCGEEFFRYEMPIHPSSMSRWRKRIGEEKLKLLLDETIRLAQEGKFGQKASIVTTNLGSFILSAKLFEGNPYDGHTLNDSIKDTEKRTNVVVKEIQVDQGYRGHDYKGGAKVFKSGDSNKNLSKSEIKRKRRRSSIEPVIGHTKSDHRFNRGFLSGLSGDAINILLSAAGKNMRKLLSLITQGRFFPAFIQIWRYLIVLLTLWRGSESSPKRLIGQ